jgi:hypothetical protein
VRFKPKIAPKKYARCELRNRKVKAELAQIGQIRQLIEVTGHKDEKSCYLKSLKNVPLH